MTARSSPRRRPRPTARRLAAAIPLLIVAAGLRLAAGPPARAAWSSAGTPPGLGTGRIWSVALSPASPAVAVAATDNGIYRSPDGGRSWTPAALPGRRVWSIAFDPRNPSIILAGTAGAGIQRSVDGGSTWTESSTGLLDGNVRSLAFGLDGVAAGTGDGVALSPDGEHWRGGGPADQLHGYSISAVAVAANAPQFTVVAGADSGPLGRGYLFRSTASGGWEVLQGGLPASAVVSGLAAGPLSQSVTRRPLLVNTSLGTFRSGDSGNTWTESTGIPRDPSPVTLTTGAFSPTDPNLTYGGADSGGSAGGELMRSTDGGASFSPASQGLPGRFRDVAAISVAATSPPQLIAAVDAPDGSVVYRETDVSAPPPPSVVAEGTGGLALPTAITTPPPSAMPAATPRPSAAPGPANPVVRFAGAAFHWPTPLVFEVLLVLLVSAVVLRWRHHYLDIEGPP